MIEVENLSKRYDATSGVGPLAFQIRVGEVVGLLGRNGAGKSTALRLITGAMPPDEGRVRLGGIDLSDHPSQAKRKLGYLPEAPQLWPELTVLQTLRFGAQLRGLESGAIDTTISQMHLQPLCKKRVGILSKGQRQKVALAFAVLGEPDVVVLDEPTDGLDPAERREVHHLIRSLTRSAVLLSSHVLPEVRAVCQRALVLVSGVQVAEVNLSQADADASLERAFFAHAA